MAQGYEKAKKYVENLQESNRIEYLEKLLMKSKSRSVEFIETSMFSTETTIEGRNERIGFLESKGVDLPYLTGSKQLHDPCMLKGSIENFIGMAQVPIGLAGPIWINGTKAEGDYHIPLATTEGALVASYSRGMKACRMSGGITSVCITEGVERSPFFKFENIVIVGKFVQWILQHMEDFRAIVERTSRYAKLIDIKTNIEGNSVIISFEFTTGDAAGQNMVTICTDQICKYILREFEYQPKEWYIESNYSGDKKATARTFSTVRGKKVVSEAVLTKEVVKNILKTTPELICKYWQSSTLAVVQSGAIGAQGHIANGLTALFLACGQDVACISESSIGITRMELNQDGDLYISVTIPSLIVGTVGGGTGLPTQKECLQIIECEGKGSAQQFAEICCAVALAGELSIAAAMSVDHFTSAHQSLGRK